MPYVKQTWVDFAAGGTAVEAARLAHMEDGIFTAQATAEAAAGGAVGPAGTIGVSNGTTQTWQTLTSTHMPTDVVEDTPGGPYTFGLPDAGKWKASRAADTSALYPSGLQFTVPTNASVPFPIGTKLGIAQWGTAQIIIAGAAGATIRAAGGRTSIAEIYGEAVLMKRFTDTWWLRGNLI